MIYILTYLSSHLIALTLFYQKGQFKEWLYQVWRLHYFLGDQSDLSLLSMHNTFEIDLDDEEFPQNHSNIKSQINERTDNKFMAGTITKNFFASGLEDDQSEYTGTYSPSKQALVSEKKTSEQMMSSSRVRRSKHHPSKLAPINQGNIVEVFQNHQKEEKDDEIQELDLASCDNSPQPLNDAKKRSPRRRGKKEEEPLEQPPTLQKKQELPKKNLEIKLPSKQNDIFFEDDPEQPQRQAHQEEIHENLAIPQNRLQNQFVDSDDEPITVTTQQLENIITGSEYFNFGNQIALIKQLYIDVREKTTLRMEIIRDKDGFNTFWPEFHLHFAEDSQYVMSAKKTASRPTSTFIISRNRTNFEEQGPQYLGKMKSNVLGDVLNIFGPGLNPSNAKQKNQYPRQLLATVVFMTSLFQMGKPRQFRLFIKNPEVRYYMDFPQVKIFEDEIPLNVLAEYPQNKDKIRVLRNRQPMWIKEAGGYMLNFRGRVQRPSIKNFILEETVNGPDVVLFGKVNDNKFNFDVSSRISTYIAFALALSSFDSRLMCE